MFFQNKFKFKYNREHENVRISIRSSEERIDEFFIDKIDVLQFCNQFNLNSFWFGNKSFQGKITDSNALVRVNIHENVRYTYVMSVSELQILNAQLSATIEENSQNENENLIGVNQIDSELLQSIFDELNYLKERVQELENRKPIETITEKQIPTTSSEIIEESGDMPIFIPSRIKKNGKLKGIIKTESNKTDFNTNKSLEKLKNTKNGEK